MSEEAAKRVWNQTAIPVIINRRGKGTKLRLRLPYRVDNRPMLASHGRLKPVWDTGGAYWEVPKAWLNKLVRTFVARFGKVYIIQSFNPLETCAPACRDAKGYDCSCSCGGANHGSGEHASWHDVSDTFSFRQGGEQLACRLLTSRQ